MSLHNIPVGTDIEKLTRLVLRHLRPPSGWVFGNGTGQPPTQVEFTPDLTSPEVTILDGIFVTAASPADLIDQGAAGTDPWRVTQQPLDLAVSATGVAAAAVTLTLPAASAKFHYIALVEIVMYRTAAKTGAATPIVVTSTNLPGNPAFTFPTAGAIGTTERWVWQVDTRLKSSVANVATTIVCPATTAVIWRVNVWYYAGT